MGWRGTEAKEVELSKKAAENVVVSAAAAAVDGGVEVLAETEAPEIERKMEEPKEDSSEWILEEGCGAGPVGKDRAGSGLT